MKKLFLKLLVLFVVLGACGQPLLSMDERSSKRRRINTSLWSDDEHGATQVDDGVGDVMVDGEEVARQKFSDIPMGVLSVVFSYLPTQKDVLEII